MPIKEVKPTTPGRRGASFPTFEEITKKEPEKSLVRPLKKTGGRNNSGVVTTRFRGGGSKRLYRVVDFRRDKDGIPARVIAIEYDPCRTAYIALLQYADGERRYILAPQGLKVGDTVMSGRDAPQKVGNALPLRNITLGTFIHAIELVPGGGAKLVRAAGAGAQLMAKEGNYAQVKLPSGEIRLVHLDCKATIGQVGNVDHENIKLGKAGRSRYLGRRPHVRGSAMTPRDHPHGGGEGRAPIGLPYPKTPWGKPARGVRTRHHKNTDKYIVQRRK